MPNHFLSLSNRNSVIDRVKSSIQIKQYKNGTHASIIGH